MGGPAYHGWTHRPMSEGGTDPIPVAASGLKWALASGVGLAAKGADQSYRTTVDNAYTNDTTGFEVTADTNWLQLNTAGYYVATFAMYKQSGGMWVNTDDVRIQPLFELSGAEGPIQDNQGVADMIGDWFNPRSEFKVGDSPDLSLASQLTFNWNPDSPVSDLDFEDPLKLAVQMVAPDEAASVSVGFQIFVMRIADAGYTDISPA